MPSREYKRIAELIEIPGYSQQCAIKKLYDLITVITNQLDAIDVQKKTDIKYFDSEFPLIEYDIDLLRQYINTIWSEFVIFSGVISSLGHIVNITNTESCEDQPFFTNYENLGLYGLLHSKDSFNLTLSCIFTMLGAAKEIVTLTENINASEQIRLAASGIVAKCLSLINRSFTAREIFHKAVLAHNLIVAVLGDELSNPPVLEALKSTLTAISWIIEGVMRLTDSQIRDFHMLLLQTAAKQSPEQLLLCKLIILARAIWSGMHHASSVKENRVEAFLKICKDKLANPEQLNALGQYLDGLARTDPVEKDSAPAVTCVIDRYYEAVLDRHEAHACPSREVEEMQCILQQLDQKKEASIGADSQA